MATLEIMSIMVWSVIGNLTGWIVHFIVTGFGFGLMDDTAELAVAENAHLS